MELFDKDIISAFSDTLKNAKSIVIIGHKNTDADCLGASFAISHFFNKKNVKTKIIIPDEIPKALMLIDKINEVMIYENAPWEAVNVITESDVIFMVDFSDFKRIDDLADSVEVSNALKINIDHHREHKEIADFSFVDADRSSASELVYEFLNIIDKKNIDKEIAQYIYMGMVSDTGNFAYDSVKSQTLKIAAELLDYKINKPKIINGLYNNYSFERMQMVGFLLSEKMKYYPDKNFAQIVLSLKTQEKFNYKNGDHENVVNLPLSISDVNFSMLIFEKKEIGIRISLRSKGDFDVNKISRKYFNGGGHKNAAGGSVYKPLDDVLSFINENIDEIIKTGLH